MFKFEMQMLLPVITTHYSLLWETKATIEVLLVSIFMYYVHCAIYYAKFRWDFR